MTQPHTQTVHTLHIQAEDSPQGRLGIVALLGLIKQREKYVYFGITQKDSDALVQMLAEAGMVAKDGLGVLNFQDYPNVGPALKCFHDLFPTVQVRITEEHQHWVTNKGMVVSRVQDGRYISFQFCDSDLYAADWPAMIVAARVHARLATVVKKIHYRAHDTLEEALAAINATFA